MNVVHLTAAQLGMDNPLFVFVDLQMEYLSQSRFYGIQQLEGCLDNCRALLDLARLKRLPIVHFRLLQSSTHFNKDTPYSDWIEEFRPRPDEMVFERSKPSCYSNVAFKKFLNNILKPQIILSGLSGDQSCLSTAIEANHRDHRVCFISDASASPSCGKLDECDAHLMVSELISRYCDVLTVSEISENIANLVPNTRLNII